MIKQIITLYGAKETGKTDTIKLVFEKLKKDGIEIIETSDSAEDFYVIFNYKKRRIGISSAGDKEESYKKPFELFDKYNCEIVICASRTSGQTVKYIKKYHDIIIWHKKVSLTKTLKFIEKEFLDRCHKINEVVAENIIVELKDLL